MVVGGVLALIGGCGSASDPQVGEEAHEPWAPPTCAVATLEAGQAWTEADLPQEGNPQGLQPGVGLADFDSDGDVDGLVAWPGGATLLWNDGTGTLTRDTTPMGQGLRAIQATAVSVADLDDDGDPDAYLGAGHGLDDVIAWNEGDGLTWRLETLPDSAGTPGSGTFADFDLDGDLDLYVAGFVDSLDMDAVLDGRQVGTGARLYRHDGDHFSDATAGLPVEVATAVSFAGVPIDADTDGDVDLYVIDDHGGELAPNLLLRNDGGLTFTRAADCGCELAMASMGADHGDFDGDGLADVFVSDYGSATLLLGDGEGGFVDASAAMRADIPHSADHSSGWGVTTVDLDRNAAPDVVVNYGESCHDCTYFEDSDVQYDQVLLNDGLGAFVRAEPNFPGLDPDGDRSRSVVRGDLDGDGRPDLVTVGKWFVRTWFTGGGCDQGLTLRLRQAGANRDAVGARVQVEAGGHVQTAWNLPSSTHSANAPELSFGLGDDTAARVTVTWPDGDTSEVELTAGAHLVERP